MGFNPGREVQKKYGKCAKLNDPENSGRSGAMFRADAMCVNDAKKAAKLQGGITQQSAEDATFRQSGVDVESAHSAGLIPPVNSALVRAFANHTPLAKETIGTASRTLNARPGFPCDGVNREPHRKEAA